MKKLLFLSVIGLVGFLPIRSSAQVHVSINIGSQPAWGPVGYDYVDYYYLPEIESYYYVPTRQFIYLNNGSWVFSLNLPLRYRHYDLYSGYKVVMNSPHPYYHFKQHRHQYRRYRGYHGRQVYIGRDHHHVNRHDYSRTYKHYNKHNSKSYKHYNKHNSRPQRKSYERSNHSKWQKQDRHSRSKATHFTSYKSRGRSNSHQGGHHGR